MHKLLEIEGLITRLFICERLIKEIRTGLEAVATVSKTKDIPEGTITPEYLSNVDKLMNYGYAFVDVIKMIDTDNVIIVKGDDDHE